MKRAIILLLVSGLASAQSKPADEEIDARFAAIAAQRNQAMDAVVVMQARIAMIEAELKKAKQCDQKAGAEKK